MTADLLLELGTEELPPLAVKNLSEALLAEFTRELQDNNIKFGATQAFATPRRLAFIINDLEEKQPDRETTRLGPGEKAAFNRDGTPSKALAGFARSAGTRVEELVKIDTSKGIRFGVRQIIRGKNTPEILPDILNAALNRLPVAKRMRWGDLEDEFVRPVRWIVFVLGQDVVPLIMFGIKSADMSYGHRFLAPQGFAVTAENYSALLNKHYVIADYDRRREIIRAQVIAEAQKSGGRALIDEKLLDEVTALCEYPNAVCGNFAKSYLEIPAEAIIAFMQGHQKFFPLTDENGKLLPRFITVSNTRADNMEAVITGNERVIRPRLADALFFWRRDKSKNLDELALKLKNVVYEERLGSIYAKSERVGRLGQYLSGFTGADSDKVARAAKIAKADLLSAMVGEFPALQGTMGRYYAVHGGEHPEVCTAIEEQYLPKFAKDKLPATKTGITLALADKFDAITGILGAGFKPAGDKDPYALRRAALGIIQIIEANDLDFDILAAHKFSAGLFAAHQGVKDASQAAYEFVMQRFRGLKTSAEAQVFAAVKTVAGGNIVDFNRRQDAVVDFLARPQAENLTRANKRIVNILKKSGQTGFTVDGDLFSEPKERDLFNRMAAMEPALDSAINLKNYTKALENLSLLKQSIDDFFDNVMVMSEDVTARNNRLGLLNMVRGQFLKVADISRI